MSGKQHIPKKKQINKSHNRTRKQGGKVEKVAINYTPGPKKDMNKDDRFNRAVQIRKNKKAKMIAERRGLKKLNLDELAIDQAVKDIIKPYTHNVAPKVVAIIPLNSCCDVEAIKNQLIKECTNQQTNEEMKIDTQNIDMQPYILESGGNLGVKRQRLIFQTPLRDPYSVMDISKVADILLFVLSCKDADIAKIRDDPDEFANAIDEEGYKLLNVLRVQGIPPSIGLLQHIEMVPQKKKNQVKKLFNRYFTSEFSADYKFHVLDGSSEGFEVSSYKNLLRMLTSTFPKNKLFWKENRSFMLCSDYRESEGNLEIEGYIKDNYISCNRIGHITGYGDFRISKIVAIPDPCPIKKHQEHTKKVKEDNVDMELATEEDQEILQTYSEQNADLFKVENDVDPFGAEQTWPTKEEIVKKGQLVHEEYKDVNMSEEPGDLHPEVHSEFKKPDLVQDDLAQLASKFEKMEIKVVGGDDRSQEDFEDEEDDDLSFDDDVQSQLNKTSFKHEKFTNLEKRERDEMDFPDEVDTPTDQLARERFNEYRSVMNIKTCNWDPFESLPKEYAQIWRFENFAQIKKLAIKTTEQEGLPIDGTYVRLVLAPLDEKAKNSVELLKLANQKQKLVFSTLMPHETKVTVSHFKIRRHEEDQNVIPSKTILEFHVGFRRFLSKPIFSDDYLHSNKAKYYRFFPHDTNVLASAYTPICFPNSQVIVFRKGDGKSDQIEIDYESQIPTLVAHGTVGDPNPLKIILKRIVLTGYPIK
jgi:pre-rRNA-processing protein TSR1